jgi:cytochrome b561
VANFLPSARYSNGAIALHWSIAALIPLSGLAGSGAIGVAIVALSVVRLGWRLTHPWLPLPTVMFGWEKALARATHIAFYVAIVGIPLLLYPTLSAHHAAPGWLAIAGTVSLFLLHAGAALKHSYIRRGQATLTKARGSHPPIPDASSPAPRETGTAG